MQCSCCKLPAAQLRHTLLLYHNSACSDANDLSSHRFPEPGEVLHINFAQRATGMLQENKLESLKVQLHVVQASKTIRRKCLELCHMEELGAQSSIFLSNSHLG